MRRPSRIFKFILYTFLSGTFLILLAIATSYIYISPNLPSTSDLRDIRLQVPLRVYTQDRKLIAEFGKMKRTPLRFHETPDMMIKALLAAEDDRFFQHPGVDYHGILRAVANLIRTGKKSQGGSTITMQVARNFFLSREKTYLRKLSEIYLALKIERELSKEEILELYLNKIYLGNRAYGVESAAQIYYGVSANQLTIAQIAMIAGLPKAPSRYNPIANPERALIRRNYILDRMYQLRFINTANQLAAKAEKDNARIHRLVIETEAPYVAEMVREKMYQTFGDDAYTKGLKVYTTIDSHLQKSANTALRKALYDYDKRHGYRGALNHTDLKRLSEMENWLAIFKGIPHPADLLPGLVLMAENNNAYIVLEDETVINLTLKELLWARKYIDDNRLGPVRESVSDILNQGDIIYVRKDAKNTWQLAQIPQVEGAITSLKSEDGSIDALVGGFDYYHSKFNRVTQANRQPGSSFKPFIYSAALNKGFTAASIINDAPVVFDDPGLESAWRPENYSGKFFGPTRLRIALMKSRNLVSIRLLRSIGVKSTIKYISRFGFNTQDLPKDLSLALGSGAITPIELAEGYAIFSNGGYHVTPHYINYVENLDGEIIIQTSPEIACPDCEEILEKTKISLQQTALPDKQDSLETDNSDLENDDTSNEQTKPIKLATRVITKENAYLMNSLMRSVIQNGTGRRARQLGRQDIAGKTGTTNDQRDAWFSGFNPEVVTIAWVGFDKTRSLGNRETGGKAALPMWIDYMREALRGKPEKPLKRPSELVTVRIDPESGLLANSNHSGAIFETFRPQYIPKRKAEAKRSTTSTDNKNTQADSTEPLF